MSVYDVIRSKYLNNTVMYSKRQRTLKNKKKKKTSMYFVDKEEQPFKNVIWILHSKNLQIKNNDKKKVCTCFRNNAPFRVKKFIYRKKMKIAWALSRNAQPHSSRTWLWIITSLILLRWSFHRVIKKLRLTIFFFLYKFNCSMSVNDPALKRDDHACEKNHTVNR